MDSQSCSCKTDLEGHGGFFVITDSDHKLQCLCKLTGTNAEIEWPVAITQGYLQADLQVKHEQFTE